MPEVLTRADRDTLFNKLATDPAFRDEMKKDWRKALQSLKIKDTDVEDSVLSRTELVPFDERVGAAGIEIEITIAAAAKEKEIKIEDSFIFKE